VARILAQTLANTDALTGALSRRNFMEVGALVLARARHDAVPMSVLMLDVDDFKQVNDRYGHNTGDDVLKMFARICMQTLRPTDMLARWGGEEFAALLPSTALADAIQISERLCNAIASGSVAAGTGPPIRVTVSIGLATSTNSSAGLEELLARADAAMYDAKRSGKNGVRLASESFKVPLEVAA
jgi:diguanylate cyclase (GGDEF)-like protein